jgi:hypothetical protein
MPSLTKGWVCLLYMLLALTSIVFLRSKSLGTGDHVLLSQIWDFPFHRLLWLAGSRWRYSISPPHGWKSIPIPVFSHILCTWTMHRKQFYCCLAQTTLKTSCVIAISPIHLCPDCCLTMSYKHSHYCCVTLSEKVCIVLLPSYTRYDISYLGPHTYHYFEFLLFISCKPCNTRNVCNERKYWINTRAQMWKIRRREAHETGK